MIALYCFKGFLQNLHKCLVFWVDLDLDNYAALHPVDWLSAAEKVGCALTAYWCCVAVSKVLKRWTEGACTVALSRWFQFTAVRMKKEFRCCSVRQRGIA